MNLATEHEEDPVTNKETIWQLLDHTDFSDSNSIAHYATHLDGMTFREVLDLGIAPPGAKNRSYGSKRYKGGLGTLLEERFFGYPANSDDRPDFPEADVELKVTPYDVLKSGKASAGERLVLTMIPYDRAVSASYDESHLKTKLQRILLVYYHRDRTVDSYDQRIERAILFSPSDEDMNIIREDYEKIISYVQDGRADELSEGLTTYLGACTKGPREADMWTEQFYPFIDPVTGTKETRQAKRRAFSLKRSYMDYVLHTRVLADRKPNESIGSSRGKTFEQHIAALIARHVGKTDRAIAAKYGVPYTGEKSQWTTLTYRMLGIKGNHAEEFLKAGINVRTVRMRANGSVRESMSFSPFEFSDIMAESWETSRFHTQLDTSRFFFVVFRLHDDGEYHLERSMFWSMPIADIEGGARRCWDAAREVIDRGVEIYPERTKSGKIVMKNNLPSGADNPVAHVRPHSNRAAYLLDDGTHIGNVRRDASQLPDGRYMTRQSFWLKNSYIASVLTQS